MSLSGIYKSEIYKLWINYIIMVNEKSEWLFCLDSNSSLINAANMLIEHWLKKYWRFSTLLSCVKLIFSCFPIVENALIRSSLYLGHSKMRWNLSSILYWSHCLHILWFISILYHFPVSTSKLCDLISNFERALRFSKLLSDKYFSISYLPVFIFAKGVSLSFCKVWKFICRYVSLALSINIFTLFLYLVFSSSLLHALHISDARDASP